MTKPDFKNLLFNVNWRKVKPGTMLLRTYGFSLILGVDKDFLNRSCFVSLTNGRIDYESHNLDWGSPGTIVGNLNGV